MGQFAKYFALAFSAVFPMIDLVGSAPIFLGMLGEGCGEVFRTLAKKIAISAALFLLIMDLAGAAVLKLFGISLPVFLHRCPNCMERPQHS
ncbi:MAG: MarC family protein [Terriglobia bacterium]